MLHHRVIPMPQLVGFQITQPDNRMSTLCPRFVRYSATEHGDLAVGDCEEPRFIAQLRNSPSAPTRNLTYPLCGETTCPRGAGPTEHTPEIEFPPTASTALTQMEGGCQANPDRELRPSRAL